MKILYITNGDPNRIPPIGAQFELKEHLFFKVEGYGESTEIDHPTQPGRKAYQLELVGCFVVPAGSPIEVFEDLLRGEL